RWLIVMVSASKTRTAHFFAIFFALDCVVISVFRS
ncbi:MAG: hypothetical protein ACI90V_013474, partial [Bacillariaceae sp.]